MCRAVKAVCRWPTPHEVMMCAVGMRAQADMGVPVSWHFGKRKEREKPSLAPASKSSPKVRPDRPGQSVTLWLDNAFGKALPFLRSLMTEARLGIFQKVLKYPPAYMGCQLSPAGSPLHVRVRDAPPVPCTDSPCKEVHLQEHHSLLVLNLPAEEPRQTTGIDLGKISVTFFAEIR